MRSSSARGPLLMIDMIMKSKNMKKKEEEEKSLVMMRMMTMI